jgi:RNA polymerase sigma-70 factor, ECF subfamily
VEVVDLSDEKPLIDLVRRIITGDEAGEEELVQRYQRGVAIIIDRVVQSKSVTEDLSQDAFKLILQKIRNQDVRDAERLSGFVCSVARNLAIDYVRKQRKLSSQEEIGKAEQVVDPRPDPIATLLARERAGIVRQLINELKVPRDREVLLRTYIAEDDKAQICADLGLTRAQLNGVVSRALKRYKDLYMKRMGWPP